MIYVCSNPATWHPTLHRVEKHHNPPKSWTLDNGASARVLPLCGLCHNEVHALLNEYVRAGGLPAWEVRRTYGVFIRQLAQEAWDLRIVGRTPYTLASGDKPVDRR